MGRKQWVLLVGFIALLMGGLFYREQRQNSQPLPLVQRIANEATVAEEGNSWRMQECLELAMEKPGDVAFVENHGWDIMCVDSGDPHLGWDLKADTQTVGYSDSRSKTIYVDTSEISAELLVHEAAHAMSMLAFTKSQRADIAKSLNKANWNDDSDYWELPTEQFAESRVRCLGFDFDNEVKQIDCTVLQTMIDQSELAGEIKDLEKRAEE